MNAEDWIERAAKAREGGPPLELSELLRADNITESLLDVVNAVKENNTPRRWSAAVDIIAHVWDAGHIEACLPPGATLMTLRVNETHPWPTQLLRKVYPVLASLGIKPPQ